jgi:hypothetical protein
MSNKPYSKMTKEEQSEYKRQHLIKYRKDLNGKYCLCSKPAIGFTNGSHVCIDCLAIEKKIGL